MDYAAFKMPAVLMVLLPGSHRLAASLSQFDLWQVFLPGLFLSWLASDLLRCCPEWLSLVLRQRAVPGLLRLIRLV